MLNVITVKVGHRYSAKYVNRMRSMLQRHLQIPFTFYCLTENPNGLDPEIQVITPPEVLHGWWNKLFVFSDLMPDGDLLYLDLDQVITGNITEIVQECLKHPFSCYSDHIEWENCKLGSAWMTFKSKSLLSVFDSFWPFRSELLNYPGGDQAWINQTGLLPAVFYFNEKWPEAVKSYKFDVLPIGKVGEGTKLVNFHGYPKPEHVAKVSWIKENWI